MADIIVKECKKHGLTEFVLRKDGRYRCKKCASDAVDRRRKKIKALIVEYKGGKCAICGYDRCLEALELHHLNETIKEFGISDGCTRSLDRAKEESDKCILVCANCHREIHAGLINIGDVAQR